MQLIPSTLYPGKASSSGIITIALKKGSPYLLL